MKNSKKALLSMITLLTMYNTPIKTNMWSSIENEIEKPVEPIQLEPVASPGQFMQQITNLSSQIIKAIKSKNMQEIVILYDKNPAAFKTANLGRWQLTPLMYAVFHLKNSTAKVDFIDGLLRLPTVNQSLNYAKDVHGRTAVFMAVEKNDMDTLQALVAYGADLTQKDNNGKTPLDLVKNNSPMADYIKENSKHRFGYGVATKLLAQAKPTAK